MIGFVCNILADEAKISRFLSSNFSMAVVGDHDGVVEEYTWFRNLSKESHTKKFICSFNREANNEIEHPGGQSPVKIQTLINPKINLFLKAEEWILEMVKESFENPQCISRPHLGRSEDVVDDIKVELIDCEKKQVFDTNGYTWMPSPEFVDDVSDSYEELYKRISGSVYRVSSVYIIQNNRRIFEFVHAKLHRGAIPMVGFKVPEVLSWNGTPIFLARIRFPDKGG